jgi:hypothetical protein
MTPSNQGAQNDAAFCFSTSFLAKNIQPVTQKDWETRNLNDKLAPVDLFAVTKTSLTCAMDDTRINILAGNHCGSVNARNHCGCIDARYGFSGMSISSASSLRANNLDDERYLSRQKNKILSAPRGNLGCTSKKESPSSHDTTLSSSSSRPRSTGSCSLAEIAVQTLLTTRNPWDSTFHYALNSNPKSCTQGVSCLAIRAATVCFSAILLLMKMLNTTAGRPQALRQEQFGKACKAFGQVDHVLLIEQHRGSLPAIVPLANSAIRS